MWNYGSPCRLFTNGRTTPSSVITIPPKGRHRPERRASGLRVSPIDAVERTLQRARRSPTSMWRRLVSHRVGLAPLPGPHRADSAR